MSKAVSGHKARDRWIIALCADTRLSELELRIAVRLAMYLNCTTGQCNPGYTKLAKATGCSTRSAIRVCSKLEDIGLILRKRSLGGSQGDKTDIDLLCRDAGAAPDDEEHHRLPVTPIVTRTSDTIASPVTNDTPVTRPAVKPAPTSDENGHRPVTLAVTQNTDRTLSQRNTEAGEPRALRASADSPAPQMDSSVAELRDDQYQLIRKERFTRLCQLYPRSRVDKAAYPAFELALDAGCSLTMLEEMVTKYAANTERGGEAAPMQYIFTTAMNRCRRAKNIPPPNAA